MLTPLEIENLSNEFETKTPQEIIAWAIDSFWPQIAMSSSFQTQSVPLLHMVSQINRNLLIYFIDTGYHFWETSIFREQLASEWHLNVLDLYRDSRWDVYARQNIRKLPLDDPNLCCYIHKVQPMQTAMKDMLGWISGIRRDQTATRAHARILVQGQVTANSYSNFPSLTSHIRISLLLETKMELSAEKTIFQISELCPTSVWTSCWSSNEPRTTRLFPLASSSE